MDLPVFGIRSIDEHHRKIFVLLDELLEGISTRTLEASDFDGAKNTILDYLVQHFADEEALMQRTAYPHTALHAQHHAAFISRVLTLFEDHSDSNNASVMTSAFSVALSLNSWLRNHVLVDDVAFKHIEADHGHLLD